MSQHDVADVSLQQGREALARHAWQEAYELLSAANASGPLAAADLDLLGEAARWTGHLGEAIEARERAYAAHLEAGNQRAAAMAALWLFSDHVDKLASSVAMGWLNRAQRLLENEAGCVEQGYLSWLQTNVSIGKGDLDGASQQAVRTLEIGSRFGDRDLQAIGLFDQGNILVAKGQAAEGMALLDEAMVAAVSGELGPVFTGIVYCSMITTCGRLADYRRAAEWTEAAKRWCNRQSIGGFPGLCRVQRAEIMRLRGVWAEAEEEARRASEELRDFDYRAVGEAFYQIGEIRLRMGDLEAAEEAFRQAHELGRDPQPGLSLLRHCQGGTDAAATMIKRALSEQSWDRLSRARLLPAQVEIGIAAEDLESARGAAEELDAIAADYGTPALQAFAACASGALQLAEGDANAAQQTLRQGIRLWQEIEAPYEAARARMLLAQAYRAQSCLDEAAIELQAARSTFEKLGAVLDAVRAAELIAANAGPVSAPSSRATRTFMFTDIVKSTNLLEAIGDEGWEDVLRWHDQALRALFAAHGGEEIKHGGDGFFVAFPEAAAAMDCAVGIQRTLAEHRRGQGFAPQVRIGLHACEATRRGRDYGGKGVHEAARIAALAEGGEILASQETHMGSAGRFPVSAARTVSVKGISKPLQVVAVEWR